MNLISKTNVVVINKLIEFKTENVLPRDLERP